MLGKSMELSEDCLLEFAKENYQIFRTEKKLYRYREMNRKKRKISKEKNVDWQEKRSRESLKKTKSIGNMKKR